MICYYLSSECYLKVKMVTKMSILISKCFIPFEDYFSRPVYSVYHGSNKIKTGWVITSGSMNLLIMDN